MLALKVRLESEIEVEYEEDDETEDEEQGRAIDEYEIDVNLGDYTAFFSWIETAIIDGIEHEIKATPLTEEEGENKMHLNYPQGDVIIHDPKIGIESILISRWNPFGSNPWFELPNLSQSELLIVSATTFVALTGLVLVFRRKSRRKKLDSKV